MSFFRSSKNAKQKEEIKMLTQEKETLRQSEEESRQKMSDIEEKTTELQRSVDRLTIENKELKAKIHTEESYERVYNERQDLIEQNAIKTGRIREMESKKKELNDAIETHRSQSIKKDEVTEKLSKDLETSKDKAEELVKEKEEMEKRIEVLVQEKREFEDDIANAKQEFHQFKIEKEEEISRALNDEKKKQETHSRAYIEDLRRELTEKKSKVENLQLESEALKSENEALFRANESKKKAIDEIGNDLNGIRRDLQDEKMRYKKLSDEWEEEKKRTEFVMVSKSAKGRRSRGDLSTFREDEDSEDEHLVSVVEAARAESEALREKERNLRKRVNQLQIDKEELFRSGTNIFAENKTMKMKYDELLNERAELLQSDMALKRKNREYEDEIKDLKKTIDDLYYQNMAIKSNEEIENRNGYVVVMGDDTVKQLEREKSALHRRVKFLERENNEIEARVVDLEKQSEDLVKYSKKYDKHSTFPAIRTQERSNIREHFGSRDRSRDSEEPEQYHDRNANRYRDDDKPRTISYHEYRDSRPPKPRTRSPDYYKNNAPPFGHPPPSRQPSIGPPPSIRSGISQVSHQGSHVSLPQLDHQYSTSPRPRANSERSQQLRRVTAHLTIRR